MKKKIPEIMDTTLRDGEQTNNVAFSPSEKMQIARILLEKVKIDRIEIASALVSPGEKESTGKILKWAKQNNYINNIEILGYVDTNKSVDWISDVGGKVLNLLTKGSIKHLKYQLKKKPEEHFNDISRTIEYAKKKKINVNVYLEDWSNGYIESTEYVYDLINHLNKNKVKRIMLPDTLGILYPLQVFSFFTDLSVKYPDTHFDFHAHNDYGLGTINTLEAVRAGASGIHCTVNCLGERTGNASLAEVAASLHDHLNIKTNLSENYLYLISRVVETFSGKRMADNAPIVGEDVFTQTAGIHADGDKKAGLYESRLMPGRFDRKRSYALGKMSGKASLDQNLKELGIELTEENHKKVLDKIKSLGDKKKKVTLEDLPFLISDILKIPGHDIIKLTNVVITSGMEIMPVCSLKICYKNNEFKITGSGDGGYDAFMNAIRNWAKENNIELPTLKDYEVRIPPGGQTSALVECKITWLNKNNETLATRGIECDQTMAAVLATEKMLNLVLT
ncbi:MAG: 2-isopropylmalate synthase [Spirochaetia bacterium]|nr:2-isopropylmalate synthase [Spirochaetia bacterium]